MSAIWRWGSSSTWKSEGYRVTTVGNGPAALELLEENEAEIDLIILDIMLPGMSGYSVCEELRQARQRRADFDSFGPHACPKTAPVASTSARINICPSRSIWTSC